jgi:predicted nucleotidyltransferase
VKITPVEAARSFIQTNYPLCRAAFLAGSVIRGEGTDTSDLDIVIIDDNEKQSHRETVFHQGWLIEAFVHTTNTYPLFFESDKKRGRPSLPRMCAEGLILKDDGTAEKIKLEAKTLIEKGPDPLTEEEIRIKRYSITDQLMDFEGSTRPEEDLFIAGSLAWQLHEFVLRANQQWIGEGKWIARALKE